MCIAIDSESEEADGVGKLFARERTNSSETKQTNEKKNRVRGLSVFRLPFPSGTASFRRPLLCLCFSFFLLLLVSMFSTRRLFCLRLMGALVVVCNNGVADEGGW